MCSVSVAKHFYLDTESKCQESQVPMYEVRWLVTSVRTGELYSFYGRLRRPRDWPVSPRQVVTDFVFARVWSELRIRVAMDTMVAFSPHNFFAE